jgi:hypothetical protein
VKNTGKYPSNVVCPTPISIITAYRSYCGDPRADHRLTLVKLNVFRAFVRNITALGYTREWMTDDSLTL